jgi:hypothetical protein
MAFEPIQFVDNLVKGTILGAYDFGRLTVSGLAFPFVYNSRRFWRSVISLAKRLSALTYLFIWVILAFSAFVSSPGSLFSYVVGRDSSSDFSRDWVFRIFGEALILTVGIDLIIRLCCLPLQNSVRRRLFETLFRIGTASIFVGFVIGNRVFGDWGIFGVKFYLLLCVFTGPVAVIATKSLRAKRWFIRLAIGLVIVLTVPYAIRFSGIYIALRVAPSIDKLIPGAREKYEVREIRAHQIYCKFSGNTVSVSGYLIVVGIPIVVLRPLDFKVSFEREQPNEDPLVTDLGRPTATGPDIVLVAGSYAKLDLTITPALAPGKPLPNAIIPCKLTLLRNFESMTSSETLESQEPE